MDGYSVDDELNINQLVWGCIVLLPVSVLCWGWYWIEMVCRYWAMTS